jgi:hypothetical protein
MERRASPPGPRCTGRISKKGENKKGENKNV